VSFELVAHLQQKAFTVSHICRVLGVSRSGYYAHRRRTASPRTLREQVYVRSAFKASGSTYGSRRIAQAVSAQGLRMGRHRARTLMHQAHLRPTWKRRFVVTTVSDHTSPIAANHLKRRFTVPQPNQAWVADITYIPTSRGWLYLAVVLDLYSRRVVGWATSATTHVSLVTSALNMALRQRRPGPGLLLHSDRGSQYASSTYQALLAAHHIQCSMSRKGNCWDNAVAERFFLSLKTERTNQQRYPDLHAAHNDIADYINQFYNRSRLHSTLGYRSPVDFETESVT